MNKFELNPLPYAYDALEPFIDKQTVEIHYSKHHKAYYDNFMTAIKGTELETMDIKDIFKHITKFPITVRNNGGGYFNHTFYWESMTSKKGSMPAGKLEEAITKTFNSIEELKKQFADAGKNRFGSGWAWLSIDDKKNLFISSTPNHDNPYMDLPTGPSGVPEKKGIPLLIMDVWEHAYYLKYQNRRADYIDAFWNLINWDTIKIRYEKAIAKIDMK